MSYREYEYDGLDEGGPLGTWLHMTEYEYAFPTRVCPTPSGYFEGELRYGADLHRLTFNAPRFIRTSHTNAMVPSIMRSLTLQAMPFCICRDCSKNMRTEDAPEYKEWYGLIGKALTLWLVQWVSSTPRAKRDARAAVLDSVMRLAPTLQQSQRAVLAAVEELVASGM